ncbi:MAG: NADH-quinone oxidoreductase subunit C [Actinomycetes bacterium]
MSDDTTTEDTAPAPADERREELVASFVAALGDQVVDSHVRPQADAWIRVTTDAWAEAAEVARHRLGARYFGFLSVIDWLPSPYGRSMDSEVDRVLAGESGPAAAGTIEQGVTGGETRFQVLARVARIGSPGEFWGLTLKADIPDDSLEIASWVRTYAGADWHEREAWEMFGVTFTGHPGLRHLYLPGDFEGHPMRKDFPLLARQVKPWPGIVDVEPMPGEDDDEGDGAEGDGS